MRVDESFEKCEGCQTSSCGTYWPDDDPHMAGRSRGCFKEKAVSVSVDSVETRNINSKDKTLTKDLTAYKRMRDAGLQPPNLDGSHKLERVLQ